MPIEDRAGDTLESLLSQIETCESVAQRHWQDTDFAADVQFHRDAHERVFLRVAVELAGNHWVAGWRVATLHHGSPWAIQAYPGRTPVMAAKALLALMQRLEKRDDDG